MRAHCKSKSDVKSCNFFKKEKHENRRISVMAMNRGNMSQQITKGPNKKKLPMQEYIGTYIKGDLGGKKVSNKSLKKYYKGLV